MDIALIIGVQTYDDAQIADLKYPDEDSGNFAKALAAVFHGEDASTTLLSTSVAAANRLRAPGRNNILRALTPPPDLPAIERLFFYFSGHGVELPKDREPYLLPSDTILDDLENSALSAGRVMQKLKSWGARTTCVFFDVCRAVFTNDKAALSYNTMDTETMDRIGLPGFATFWSCSPGQSSFECDHPEVRGGVFTRSLCTALTHESTCRTIGELRVFLERDMAKICALYQGPQQHQKPYVVLEPAEVQDRYLISISKLRETTTSLSRVKLSGVANTRRITADLEEYLPLWCGFDFGTSHSVCAVSNRSGKVVLVPINGQSSLLPSTLRFSQDFKCQIGSTASEGEADEQSLLIYNVKRMLGQQKAISVAGLSFRPEELASLIIRQMRDAVEAYFGRPIERVIASAPTRFSIRQCESLLEAFKLAGLKVARLIPEPAAASLLVATQEIKKSYEQTIVLVLDLGGGTLDVAILEYGDGICEIKASTGDRALGGMDYDNVLAQYLKAQGESLAKLVNPAFFLDELTLRDEAERVKKALGLRHEVAVFFEIETERGIIPVELMIGRVVFRGITSELDRRVRCCIEQALAEAAISADAINRILVAGLGSKVFTVRELVSELFPHTPIEERFQETAVGSGLGLYTGVLRGVTKDVLLLDALSTEVALKCHSIGERIIQVHSQVNRNTVTEVLLARNTTIPTKRTVELSVVGPPVEVLTLSLVERGDDLNPEEADLGVLPLQNISTGDRLRLIGDVDANRTICVTVWRFIRLESKAFAIPKSGRDLTRRRRLRVRLTTAERVSGFLARPGNRIDEYGDGLVLEFGPHEVHKPISVDISEHSGLWEALPNTLCQVTVQLSAARHFIIEAVDTDQSGTPPVLNISRVDELVKAQINNNFAVAGSD